MPQGDRWHRLGPSYFSRVLTDKDGRFSSTSAIAQALAVISVECPLQCGVQAPAATPFLSLPATSRLQNHRLSPNTAAAAPPVSHAFIILSCSTGVPPATAADAWQVALSCAAVQLAPGLSPSAAAVAVVQAASWSPLPGDGSDSAMIGCCGPSPGTPCSPASCLPAGVSSSSCCSSSEAGRS